jgi:electron transfer flavoprotein-quinone oxidoreductase
MDRFDAIIVGTGLAGCAAAVALGKAGRRTLWVGPPPPDPGAEAGGSGLLYTRRLDPTLSAELPGTGAERHLTEIRWVVLRLGGSASVDFRDPAWEHPTQAASLVSRPTVQSWLFEAAAKAGVEIRRERSVESLVSHGARGVSGIRVGDAEIEAPVTVLTRRDGRPEQPSSGAAGREDRVIEEAFQLSSALIDRRFSLGPQQGIAFEILPERAAASPSYRAFITTHREQLRLGVILHAPEFGSADSMLRSTFTNLRSHPTIAPLLRDAASLGTSHYGIPNGTGPLAGPSGAGFLRAGEALGLPIFDGIRPIRLDIELRSGWAAGQAISKTSVGPTTLRTVGDAYRSELRSTGLLAEARRMRAILGNVTWNPDLSARYPIFLDRLLHEMMTETGAPKSSVRSTVRRVQKASRLGVTTLVRDALRMGGSL